MQLASRVMEQVNAHNPDAMFGDGAGLGRGVHDRLNQLACPNLVRVDFGARADRTDASDAAARYANKREWLKGPTATIRRGRRAASVEKQGKSMRSPPKLMWQICNICWTDETLFATMGQAGRPP